MIIGYVPLKLFSDDSALWNELVEYHKAGANANIETNINADPRPIVRWASHGYKWLYKILTLNLLELIK